MMDGVEENREEPRPTIGPALEAMERLPGLETGFLHCVLGGRLLAQQPLAVRKRSFKRGKAIASNSSDRAL
jgi:hypothetical protein